MERQVVEVVWEDAVGTGEWEEPETLTNEPALSYSVGYLVKRTKRAITLVSLMNENHVSMRMTIPMGMVKEVRSLS